MAKPEEHNMTTGTTTSLPSNWLEHTQYIAKTLYEDPSVGPIQLDLHSACAIGKYDCVQEAVNRKEDLNRQNKGGWTPLMYAAYVGHDTVLNLLLDAHADPNKGTPTGLTPLMVAAGCGNESVCYFLIQNHALMDQQDSQGCTALYHATRQGHQSTVQLLLKEGADMEIGDYQSGYTPLMIAAMEGDQIVLDVLVACNADINAKAYDGHTARSLALKHNNIKTVTFLDEIQMVYYPRSCSAASNESDLPSVSSFADTDEDVHSGTEETENVSQSKISKKLGRRSGPRWSLPTGLMGSQRASLATTQRRFQFSRSSYSMPESNGPPEYDDMDEEEDPLNDSSYNDNMAKLAEFLEQLELDRYYEIFESHEIGFSALLELSEEDLKKLVDKMGPRRKLQVAIKQMKEQMEIQRSGDMSRSQDITPTPERNIENEYKNQISQLRAAYQQVTQSLESCERRLSTEHELRKMAERYCQELQHCRAQSLEATKTLKDTLISVLKHCQSLRATQSKLTTILKEEGELIKTQKLSSCLRELSGEIEAVSRSSQQANREFKGVQYHLSASFPA